MSLRSVTFLIAAALLLSAPAFAQASWITFTESTSTYLSVPNVATDSEEKDFGLADLDQDGDLDLVNVRKEGFYADGPRTHMLIMNVGGVMTDQTTTYAPDFIANPSLARVVLIGDFDADTWLDVIVVNTNSGVIATNYQVHYYKNLGSSGGNWLGLQLQSGRVPVYSAPTGRFCSGAAGDVDGDGDLDIFLGDYNNGLENRIVFNDGTGHFVDQTSTSFVSGNNSSTFSVEANFADADGDGDLDLFESDGTVGLMKVHINNGSGVFTTQTISSGAATYTNAIGDLNNDGKIDIYQGRDGQDAYSINNSTPGNISFATTSLNNLQNPKTTNFAGNAYVVDIDVDGDNDIVMGDTDVDVPGCDRRAVLYRNSTIGVAQNQLLEDPWGNPNVILNVHTQGTHDIAVLDLNNDGLPDMIYGNCVGYKVFIQNGQPFSLAVTEPAPGGLSITINNGAQNQLTYTLVATVQLAPAGSGSFFGLDPSAFTNFVQLYTVGEPIVSTTNGSGHYAFSLPAGTLPSPFPTQWRAIQLVGPSGISLSNVSTVTF